MHVITINYSNGGSERFEVSPNRPIFFALSDVGKEIPHGCLAGACGSCLIKVLEGMDNLSELTPVEENTLTRILGEDISNHRLACRAEVLGDITILIIS